MDINKDNYRNFFESRNEYMKHGWVYFSFNTFVGSCDISLTQTKLNGSQAVYMLDKIKPLVSSDNYEKYRLIAWDWVNDPISIEDKLDLMKIVCFCVYNPEELTLIKETYSIF